MKPLTTLRDEMAKRFVACTLEGAFYACADSDKLHADLSRAADRYESGFKTGWDALLSHLEGAAGEFDERAAKDFAREEVGMRSMADGAMVQLKAWSWRARQMFRFAQGARWQFEQDRARIALAEMVVNDWRSRAEVAEARLAESQLLGHGATLGLHFEIESLETKLAASERAHKTEVQQLEQVCADVGHRLAAAEAENARLRAALNDIASWDEGDVVRGNFDEPCSAEIAREALK